MYRSLRFTDLYQLIRPTGPVFAFVFPWTIVLLFQQMALCRILVPYYSSFYLIILGNILTAILGMSLLHLIGGQAYAFDDNQEEEGLKLSIHFKRITYFFVFFNLAFQVFQFIYFKGFPLLWLLQGGGRAYTDYGLPSLNGLLNAIYLLSTTAYYLIYLKEKSRGKLLLLWILLALPILLISRQLLISMFLQITCCSLIYNPKRVRRFAIIGLSILAIFVIVGNFRTGLTHLVQILDPEPYIPEWLHSLLWIYAYITTPFNNVNASIDQIRPLDAPVLELLPLLPSVFRSMLHLELRDTGYSLVNSNMNVSTFYLAPILDFGRTYAFCFMFVFQIILYFSFRKATRTKAPMHIIEYTVLYMVMILSIFDNLFLFLPVITQLFIINITKLRLLRKSTVLILGWGSH